MRFLWVNLKIKKICLCKSFDKYHVCTACPFFQHTRPLPIVHHLVNTDLQSQLLSHSFVLNSIILIVIIFSLILQFWVVFLIYNQMNPEISFFVTAPPFFDQILFSAESWAKEAEDMETAKVSRSSFPSFSHLVCCPFLYGLKSVVCGGISVIVVCIR